MDDLDDIITEFLMESHENLDRLDQDLVALEGEPSSKERLSSIFRTIHTIKGTSGFLALSKLETVAHAGENLLAKLRDGSIELTPARTDLLLKMVDSIRAILVEVERTGTEGDTNITALSSLIEDSLIDQTAVSSPVDVGHTQLAPLLEPAEDACLTTGDGTPEPANFGELTETDIAPMRSSLTEGSVRVDVSLLDGLMRMVGELVLTRNQIVENVAQVEDPSLLKAAQRLNLIASELQAGVMSTRMQPIDQVWSKYPRLVRDIAGQCAKRVRLEMEGADTELDKTLLEAVKDPLTHLVRNAIDHGIEAPEVRVALGKPAEGRLHLRALHESGQVAVEISDDGAGIDPDRVAEKAVERGLVTADHVRTMTNREIIDLIFQPGFSTAAAVTNVSGRGVGMDVVRTNVEKIGGAVDVESTLGAGTTVRVKIPLTLAIIPALIVSQSGVRYAIPQSSLLELVRLDGKRVDQAIETIAGAPVFRLRGKLLPLVNFGDLVGEGADVAQGDVTVVVLHAHRATFGLVVHEVHDAQEIVVKPLGRALGNVELFAGATIMGDGTVALIIDTLGVARSAGAIRSESRSQPVSGPPTVTEDGESREMMLVVESSQQRFALPLADVSRLEEVPVDRIEKLGLAEVLQYRGTLLPLMRLSSLVPAAGHSPASPTVPVVVHTVGDARVGVIVDRIVDVVDESIQATEIREGAAIRGAAVIQRRATHLLDMAHLRAMTRLSTTNVGSHHAVA